MKEEWWLTAAVSDDRLVADLLLRLKDSAAHPLPPPAWGMRQPRSSTDKNRDAHRRSPTTPLSWTAAASPSHDSSGHHTDHHHPPAFSDRFPSKISALDESHTTLSKRPSRKKTFAELKEEESSLLEEQTYLKRELATLRSTLVEQRWMNDNLKRRKLELAVESGIVSESDPTEPKERKKDKHGSSEATSSKLVKFKTWNEPYSLSSLQPGFVLPDLNMIPTEDCVQDDIFGMS